MLNPESWHNLDEAHTISILRRHGTHKGNQIVHCSTEDKDVLKNFTEMPFLDPIIKDEVQLHVLRS